MFLFEKFKRLFIKVLILIKFHYFLIKFLFNLIKLFKYTIKKNIYLVK